MNAEEKNLATLMVARIAKINDSKIILVLRNVLDPNVLTREELDSDYRTLNEQVKYLKSLRKRIVEANYDTKPSMLERIDICLDRVGLGITNYRRLKWVN